MKKLFFIMLTIAFTSCEKEYNLVADYSNTMDKCNCTAHVGSDNASHYLAFAQLKDSFVMIPLDEFEDYEGSNLQESNPTPFNYDNIIVSKNVGGCGADSMRVNCISNQNLFETYKSLLINDYFKLQSLSRDSVFINQNQMIIKISENICDDNGQCDIFKYVIIVDLSRFDSIRSVGQYNTRYCYYQYYEANIFIPATGTIEEVGSDSLNICDVSKLKVSFKLPNIQPVGEILRSRDFIKTMFLGSKLILRYEDVVSNGGKIISCIMPIDNALWGY